MNNSEQVTTERILFIHSVLLFTEQQHCSSTKTSFPSTATFLRDSYGHLTEDDERVELLQFASNAVVVDKLERIESENSMNVVVLMMKVFKSSSACDGRRQRMDIEKKNKNR